MTYYQHVPFRENIPAYALGALDAEEAAALEAHLRTCESCREELAAYRAASDHFLAELPPQQPSAALRRHLQKQIPSAPKNVPPHRNWSFSRLAVALAILLLLALNVFSISQVRALQRQQTQLIAQMQNGQMALTMLSYAHTRTFSINEDKARGTFLLDKEYNNAVLILRGLPPISASQAYQIWLIAPNGDRVSAGLVRPQTDQPILSEAINATQDLSKFVGLGMTVEPAGGSDHPTGMQIFRIDF
jgi:anti-sigma-K factor RskA